METLSAPPAGALVGCGNSFCTAHRACWQPVETVSAPLTEALTACRNSFPASFQGCFRPLEAASTPAIEFAGGFFRGRPQGLPATCRSNFYARPQRLWGIVGACSAPAAEAAGSLWKQVLLPSTVPSWDAISAPPTEPAGSLWKQFLHPHTEALAACGDSICTQPESLSAACGGNFCTSHRCYWQPLETAFAPPTDPADSLWKQLPHPPQRL